MNEPVKSIWNRPWQSPRALLLWMGLLAIACFIIIFGFGWWEGTNPYVDQLVAFSAVASVALALAITGVLFFLRWLCCWQNLRRFLFVIVCLVTLVALAIAEENWRGRHAWNSYRSALEAKGEKFDVAALAPPPVPDNKNFALAPLLKPMLDYTQAPSGPVVWGDTNGQARLRAISADLNPQRDHRSSSSDANGHLVPGNLEKGTFADMTACAAFYAGNTNYPQAPAGSAPAQVILTALGKFSPDLEQLQHAATTRPYSRFPIHYSDQPCWAILLPHLATVKSLTQVLHVRATAELEAGRSADALTDLKLGWRLSDSIDIEPLLIDHLVRIASMSMNLQTVREGLVRHAWTEPQLMEMQTNLAALDLLKEYGLAMRGERALLVGSIEYLRRHSSAESPLEYQLDGGGQNSWRPPLPAFPSGWFYQNIVTMCRLIQEFTLRAVDEQTRRVFPWISDRGSNALAAMRLNPYNLLAKILMPALDRAANRSARMQTYADAARVACALERYRQVNKTWPESLEPLVPGFIGGIPRDVIDGKPLRYRRSPDRGYILYSIGWNQRDDGGQVVWAKDERESPRDESRRDGRPRVDFTQGDWVWSMPR